MDADANDAGPDGHAEFVCGKTEHERASRDEKLRTLLPSKNAPYDYKRLSKAETDALVEALSDGFGDVLVAKTNSFPLPINVNSGLLDHSVHCPANSEYDPQEYTEPFWRTDDDRPATYQWFPLGFEPRRLRIYFENQFDRFCEQFTRECREVASLDRLQDRYLCEHEAALALYEKPWYEFHALQYLDWVKISTDDASKRPVFTSILAHGFCGQLGRLVEQYYWRFRFEEAAVTGIGARKGAECRRSSKG
jgi:hypothetical protein